ncbi:MAG: right-handed parallel beta-helix repeat-containing protein [Candidatus Eisenbacteria sp.]|nr:right-handed parallel beta-helix repeat-containing protein [Candidatus Eisenbacteria bacterium]
MLRRTASLMICCLVFWALGHVVPALAVTLWVPDDHASIQLGIDAASPGDTVMVSSGRYVENIDFRGKQIVVKSHDGPLQTVIDGGMISSVVRFRSGEGDQSILEGFTLTKGGGVVNGGGIHCSSASPTILNNWIVWNLAGGGSGGGVCCDSSSAPTLYGNVIACNTAGGIGGHGQGGGIVSYDSSSPFLHNNLIAWNQASQGGGVCLYGSSSCRIENCTFYGNSGSGQESSGGGGLLCGHYSEATVINSIFWANESPRGPQLHVGSIAYPGSLTISYSDVAGGEAAVFVDTNCVLDWGLGMFDASPLFAWGNGGQFYLSHAAAGQETDSPCIDAGSDLASSICAAWAGGSVCMNGRAVRTDHVCDSDQVDLGHHPAGIAEWQPAGVLEGSQEGRSEQAKLHRAHPNPGHSSATIRFDVRVPGPVSLQVLDLNGRLVRNLLSSERVRSGAQEVVWDGRDDLGHQVESGVYLYRLRTRDSDKSNRIVLFR